MLFRRAFFVETRCGSSIVDAIRGIGGWDVINWYCIPCVKHFVGVNHIRIHISMGWYGVVDIIPLC